METPDKTIHWTNSPLKKLETEISRLRALYFSSWYSFRQTSQEIIVAIKSGSLDPKAPLTLTLGSGQSAVVANNAYAFFHKNKSQFPRYLRETIFIRLISALEVFLIDIIREIFLARRDLFHADQRIEFSFGELLATDSVAKLWTRLINRELRRLQNQGFAEIIKFYRQRLGIDLAKAGVPMVAIEEFHERRHILVHRLGRTDDEYRHRYNSNLKILPVTEEYLLACLTKIDEFGRVVSEQAKATIAERFDKPPRRELETEMKIVVELSSKHIEFVLDRAFSYKIGDAIGRLGDILLSHEQDGQKHILTIGGEGASVRGYLTTLKEFERRNDLVIHAKDAVRWNRRAHCTLPNETIERIAKSLPTRPWPKHIHKEVAHTFGISNKSAMAAVDMILSSEKLSCLIGTGVPLANINMEITG